MCIREPAVRRYSGERKVYVMASKFKTENNI